MQQPFVYSLTVYAGATFSQTFLFELNGSPIDFTSCSASCLMKRSANDATAVATFTVTFGTPPEGGAVTLSMTDEETSAIETTGEYYADTDNFYYDLKINRPDGTAARILEGPVTVSPEVSRNA